MTLEGPVYMLQLLEGEFRTADLLNNNLSVKITIFYLFIISSGP